ncbi:MAG: hypothetical protein P8J86_00845 [Phycisphaerales bacterium]|nr:hypothetical protein [Phycisphaerales bacterium]
MAEEQANMIPDFSSRHSSEKQNGTSSGAVEIGPAHGASAIVNHLNDEELDQWLAEFREAEGRAPRVLHIGNIANNAYLNAKILNRRGFECDVICYDYYHIMGCPEWEELQIVVSDIDHFAPQWHELDLTGFERPRWFVQGPHQTCLEYLLAKQAGNTLKAESLWANLVGYWSGKVSGSSEETRRFRPIRALARLVFRNDQRRLRAKVWVLQSGRLSLYTLRKVIRKTKYGMRNAGRYFVLVSSGKRNLVKEICYRASDSGRATVVKVQHGMFRTLEKSGGDKVIQNTKSRVMRWLDWYWLQSRVTQICLGIPMVVMSLIVLMFMPLRRFWQIIESVSTKLESLPPVMFPSESKLTEGFSFPEEQESKPSIIHRINILAEKLAKAQDEMFPEEESRISSNDIIAYASVIEKWSEVLAYYDVVIGYATDGILPLLCEKRPYLAFEHGTIRSIPFEKTKQGRLCALTYRSADMSLITNCDNIDAVHKLKLDKYRFVPHPINEDLQVDASASQLRASLCEELDTDFIVFHPARQHWEEARHPSWEKGNDILIRGFARFVHECCPKASAIFVEWGLTVDATKELLEECGISDRVKWIAPVPNYGMIEYILASDVVADQFYLGAFGSLTPKALLHGRPVLLRLDEDRHRWCFPELPPILNTSTPEEAVDHLRRLYQDPEYTQELCKAGKRWYQRYHSNNEIARVMGGSAVTALTNTLV